MDVYFPASDTSTLGSFPTHIARWTVWVKDRVSGGGFRSATRSSGIICSRSFINQVLNMHIMLVMQMEGLIVEEMGYMVTGVERGHVDETRSLQAGINLEDANQ